MKVLIEQIDKGRKEGNTVVLIMDRREAKTLVDIAEAAHESNKRKATWRTWYNRFVELLPYS